MSSLLTDQPIELLHTTLLLVPVRQLHRMRGVSKYFRDYIDNNELALVKGTIAHHRTRLPQRIEFLSSEDFEEALQHCFSYYGLPNQVEDFAEVVATVFRKPRMVIGTAHWDCELHRTLELAVNRLQLANIQGLTSRTGASAVAEVYHVIDRMAPELEPGIGARVLQAVAKHETVHSSRYTELYGVPKHFLTRREVHAVHTPIRNGVCDELPLFLGLPNVMKRKGSGACLACHSSSKQLYWRRYSSGREADVCVGPSDATLQVYGLETIGKWHNKSAPLDKE